MTDTHKGDDAALIEMRPKRRARRDWNEAMAQAYSDGQRDALAEREWLQDKAWADAVMMLVHYQGAAALPHLVGHDRAVEGLERAWADARRLAATRTAEDIAALNATDDASLVKGEEPSGSNLTLIQAFEIGYAWRGQLVGQTLEDSRAVGRTLQGPLFDALNIDLDGWNSFESADLGVCEAKRRILAALAARGAGQGEAVALEDIFDHIRALPDHRPGTDQYKAGCAAIDMLRKLSPPVGGSGGWRPDREAVARIVDHDGYWERLDGCNHALSTVQMTAAQRHALTAVRDDELRGTAESLTKADLIIALLRALHTKEQSHGG